MNTKYLNWLLSVLLFSLPFVSPLAFAEDQNGVVLINIIYKDGAWHHQGTTVLPC